MMTTPSFTFGSPKIKIFVQRLIPNQFWLSFDWEFIKPSKVIGNVAVRLAYSMGRKSDLIVLAHFLFEGLITFKWIVLLIFLILIFLYFSSLLPSSSFQADSIPSVKSSQILCWWCWTPLVPNWCFSEDNLKGRTTSMLTEYWSIFSWAARRSFSANTSCPWCLNFCVLTKYHSATGSGKILAARLVDATSQLYMVITYICLPSDLFCVRSTYPRNLVFLHYLLGCLALPLIGWLTSL